VREGKVQERGKIQRPRVCQERKKKRERETQNEAKQSFSARPFFLFVVFYSCCKTYLLKLSI